MAGTELPPGANLVNDNWIGYGRGNAGGGTGRVPWQPATIRDPFTFNDRPMTPAEAQAAIANAVANPIAPVPFTLLGPRYRNGYHIEDVRVEDQQEQKPENPGRRYVSASTWGRTIPISMGKRRLEGNILQSTALVPVLEGTTEYYVEYKIPVYADPPEKPGGVITVTYPADDRPRPSPGSESGCNRDVPCDTRSSPGVADEGLFVITVELHDPSPSGPFTVNIVSLSVATGGGSTTTADCPALNSCFGQATLTGTGPWTLNYTINSDNPGPGVELEVDVTSNEGSGASESGFGSPHTGVISINTSGDVTGIT